MVLSHVPPGEVIYILFAKMSLFVIVPAFLALPWCAYRLIRARRRPTRLDDRAAFALSWFSMLLPFGLLNIVVGTHYMLPLAPAVTFVGAWAFFGAARWLGPRVAADGLVWLRRIPISQHQAAAAENALGEIATPRGVRLDRGGSAIGDGATSLWPGDHTAGGRAIPASG